MGYFDTLKNNHFKITKEGHKVFYPQGAIGRVGYIIPDKNLENRLEKAIIRFYLYMFFGSIFSVVLGAILGFSIGNLSSLGLIGLLSVLTFIGWFLGHLYFRTFTKNLELSKEVNCPISRWTNMSDSMGWLTLLSLSALSLAFAVFSFCFFFYYKKSFVILLNGIMFTLFCVPYFLSIKNKLKKLEKK